MPEEPEGTEPEGDDTTKDKGKGADRTFSQAEVNDIVKERIAKERAKFGDVNELRRKATEYDKLAEANKSEIEKAQEAAAEAQRRAEQAELRALRTEVAGEKGLSTAQAKRLVGANREELEADADELLADFTPADNGDTKAPGRPAERLKGGGDPTEEPEPDIRKVVAEIPRSF